MTELHSRQANHSRSTKFSGGNAARGGKDAPGGGGGGAAGPNGPGENALGFGMLHDFPASALSGSCWRHLGNLARSLAWDSFTVSTQPGVTYDSLRPISQSHHDATESKGAPWMLSLTPKSWHSAHLDLRRGFERSSSDRLIASRSFAS